MKQRNRVTVYLVGAIIGLSSAYFIFFSGKSNTSYMPNSRVLLRLESTLQLTPRTLCMFECHQMGEEEIINLFSEGNVEFFAKETKTGEEVKDYLILGENSKGEEVRMVFKMNQEICHLLTISSPSNPSCSCEE